MTHVLCRDMTEYNTAKALLNQLEEEYENLNVEYKAIEEQYVDNNELKPLGWES